MSRYLSLLAKLAKTSTLPQKHATIVLRGGAVISFGHNGNYKHSEVVALSRVKYKSCLTLLNIRVKRSGEIGLSRPCKSCMKYIKANGVVKVLYTDDTGRLQSERI
jgi:deoxycytidylate deaminase